MKSAKLLLNFAIFCARWPKLSFWQALRSWSDYNYILASDECAVFKNQFNTAEWEGRRGKEKSSS
jgi:hypothetical protein